MSVKMNIKKGDTVVMLSGTNKGKKGKVLVCMPDEGKVIVEGIAMSTQHKKPRRQGDQGGIIKKETPVYACKVMRVCDKCHKPSRFGTRILDDGKKVRFCKKCNEVID